MERLLPPVGVWFAAAALYIAVILPAPDGGGIEAPLPAPLDTTAPEQTVLTLDLGAPADIAAITARPLFVETRRKGQPLRPEEPPQPQAEVEEAPEISEPLPPVPPEGLRLLGTMRAQSWRALVSGPGSTPERWIAEGAQISGWQLRDIDETSATFGQGPSVFSITIQR